jgi:signal transduction histidine kinase
MNADAENVRALRDLLRTREEEKERLARELEDTNRGVLALYAEIDDRATLLRTANELKDQFISHLSHEFRTPLNSIIALSGMLLESRSDPADVEQRRQAAFIRKSALELLGMVNDLLDLAKIESGRLEVHVEDVTVANVLSSLRAMMRPLLSEDVELFVDEGTDIPDLRTDVAKLTSVLRNLISNALKFTERGSVSVKAFLRDDRVVFEVRDTGIGIPSTERERIFDAFTQVDNPIQRNVKGTGLGLSLSRKLSVAIGGSLHVESEVGVGSTFYLELPLRPDRPTS